MPLVLSRVDKGRVIVEGFIDFDYEITQLTVRASDGQGGIATHFCASVGHRQQSGDYVESWQPQAMSELALQRARDMAKAVTEALGGRGLFGVELFVKGDQVWFSEVSPRPHDTGLVTLATQRFSEFDLHARALLGLPVDASLQSPGASAVIYGGMAAARHCLRRVGRSAGRAGRGYPPVWQTGKFCAPSHGRGRSARRGRGNRPLARAASRRLGQTG
nr:ATP-grasp domain-containing protein [Paludibacterium denitrificans]